MRTTVTLDPDVERLLKDAVRKSGRSFKDVLNRAVREGLAAQAKPQPGKPFRVRARKMGLRRGIDPGSLNRLVDEMDIEDFLERQRRPQP
jgi:hypothetical protein